MLTESDVPEKRVTRTQTHKIFHIVLKSFMATHYYVCLDQLFNGNGCPGGVLAAFGSQI